MNAATRGPEAPAPQMAPRHAPAPQATAPARTNGKAIAALVLTLIGLLILPIVFSTIGIVLAVLARKEIKRDPYQGGQGLATSALILGPLGIVLGAIVGIAMFA